MELKEGGRGVACTRRNFAGVGPLGDAEQQADQQIAPEQSDELVGKFRRVALQQSGFLRLGHDFSQGDTTRFAPYRIERPRHLGRVDGLGNCQSKYANDGWIADLVDKPGSH